MSRLDELAAFAEWATMGTKDPGHRFTAVEIADGILALLDVAEAAKEFLALYEDGPLSRNNAADALEAALSRLEQKEKP